jgi:predicted Ser/Thr protein kinase
VAAGDPGSGFSVSSWLEDLGRRSDQQFRRARRILSYGEYLREVAAEPDVHVRDAASWIRDMFDHFGTREVPYPWGVEKRFVLFDQQFEGGGDPLIGEESVQQEFYRAIRGFVRDGRPTRMILLHGPNGSSKSTFVQCVMRAMEHYSSLDGGARYRFNWVFPRERSGAGSVGFLDRTSKLPEGGSFAHADESDIEVRLCCELKDHPLLLLPRAERIGFLEQLESRRSGHVPDSIAHSGLCPKCKLIFDALMASYRGDLRRVLSHVQVERFFVSRGYRRAAVTIGPQVHVDASERQVTMDQSLSSLPRMLARVSLYEFMGDMVDGAGGLVEFGDFLKRPLDATKYLLGTLENGEVDVGQNILRVDAVIVGTTNEIHLAGFRQQPEYLSYLGRLHLVKVPYIMHEPTERAIYSTIVEPRLGAHVSPHALQMASSWGVLTRLDRPKPENFESPLAEIVGSLTAMEKLDFYSTGRPPERLSAEAAVELRKAFPEVKDESEQEVAYEGILGASPREVKIVLDRVNKDSEEACITAMGVLREVAALSEKVKDFPFLSQEAEEGGYNDADAFVEGLTTLLLDLLEVEALEASGLVTSGGYEDIWRRYVLHATASVKGEKVKDPDSGKNVAPDRNLMKEVEAELGLEGKPGDFRQGLMTFIAGWAIDHRGSGNVDFCTLFSHHVATLKRRQVEKNHEKLAGLVEEVLEAAEKGEDVSDNPLVASMVEMHGYCAACAVDTLAFLRASRLVPDADDDSD